VGLCLLVVGVVVHLVGSAWIDRLMPPIVTGAIASLLGLNPAPPRSAGWSVFCFQISIYTRVGFRLSHTPQSEARLSLKYIAYYINTFSYLCIHNKANSTQQGILKIQS